MLMQTPEPVFVNVSRAKQSIPLAYVACPAGTTNRVAVPARQAENRFLVSLIVHKYGLCAGILE